MIESELMVLDRAHRLFAGHPEAPAWDAGRPPHRGAARYPQAPNVGAGQRAYELAADQALQERLLGIVHAADEPARTRSA